MTFEEYILLSEDQKLSVLWCEANFIAERKEIENKLFLYQVYSFYIEVLYSSNSGLNQLRPFSSTEELEPYLEEIDISSLIHL